MDLNVNNTHGSVQNSMTIASTCISRQCDNLRVDEWSNLSKNQKKRLKAKSSGKTINKGINKEICELKDNVFAKHEALRNQSPTMIIITAQDPLIIAIHDVIDEQFGHVKLKDEDIISVVKIVNDRNMKD